MSPGQHCDWGTRGDMNVQLLKKKKKELSNLSEPFKHKELGYTKSSSPG